MTSLSLFQSTCPARGTTPPKLGVVRTDAISIHVPREGHDLDTAFSGVDQFAISIHVPREGHDQTYLADAYRCRKISIHVPREGHDTEILKGMDSTDYISIHVPREGHDSCLRLESCGGLVFQSTCPARGTTRHVPYKQNVRCKYFNPRAPRGARLDPAHKKEKEIYFNPRAPRGARPNNEK